MLTKIFSYFFNKTSTFQKEFYLSSTPDLPFDEAKKASVPTKTFKLSRKDSSSDCESTKLERKMFKHSEI
jgi:hypothetical protein